MNYDKLNGYGVAFRFITPILVTVSIFLMGLLIQKQGKLEEKFDNHLHHHTSLEVALEKRLSSIETRLRMVDENVSVIERAVRGVR